MAVKISATFWAILWFDPNSTLKKYRVGAQINSVAKNIIGSFKAELIACHKLWLDPITAPYRAKKIRLDTSIARIFSDNRTPSLISLKKWVLFLRIVSIIAKSFIVEDARLRSANIT